MSVEDFPEERNECYSEKACGMEEWRCRVSDDPFVVSLKWHYPFRKVIYCSIGICTTFLFSFLAVHSFLKGRAKNDDDENCDDDCDKDIEAIKNSIPFFRCRSLLGPFSRTTSAASQAKTRDSAESV